MSKKYRAVWNLDFRSGTSISNKMLVINMEMGGSSVMKHENIGGEETQVLPSQSIEYTACGVVDVMER
jgi:hypothetical protein